MTHEKISTLISTRAENLFLSQQYMCSESLMLAVNHGLGSPLSENTIISLAAGFPEGLGGSRCLCGALSGGTMALGLLMGQENAYKHRKEIRAASQELHNEFKKNFGATCCRVLTKKLEFGSQAHFKHCVNLTTQTAALTTQILLQKCPKLAQALDPDYLNKHSTRLHAIRKHVASTLCEFIAP